jgi:hypothetical protein
LWTFATTNSYRVDEQLYFVAFFSSNFDQLNGLFDDTINEICHQIHAYTTSNESFTYLQKLQQEDFRQFFQAMEMELDNHETHKHWDLMKRKDLPPGTKTIMPIWSFKCKCFPDETLNKHKAWLCAHGGQQTWGQDYWDTYAPVVM